MTADILGTMLPEGVKPLIHLSTDELSGEKLTARSGYDTGAFYEAENCEQVNFLHESGVEAKHIFIVIGDSKSEEPAKTSGKGTAEESAKAAEKSTAEELAEVIWKCTPVACGMEAFAMIDEAVSLATALRAADGEKALPPGYLFPVGIYMKYSENECEQLIRYDFAELKKLQHITLRGCFIDMAYDKNYGQRVNASYQAAKRLTVDIPCAMPFMCFKGAQSALQFENECDITVLETVAMQNQTAFYSNFLID